MEGIFSGVEAFLRSHRAVALAAIFCVVAGLYLSMVSDELGGNLGGDKARYIMLARAIAKGQGYTDTWTPSQPPSETRAHAGFNAGGQDRAGRLRRNPGASGGLVKVRCY